ncbi:MAG: NAD(P)-binding domain-containing protein [Candidatus Nanopelagicales bacterium]
MTLGLIGSGRIGSTLARLAVDHGEDVVLSNSRGPETLADVGAALGPRARAATPQEAARDGDLVVVTIPLRAIATVPVDELVGKVVIDTGNYYPDRDGRIDELEDGSTTSSELLAAHLPGSHVVKAFNTIYFEHLAAQGLPVGTPGRRALPVAGDDAGAKAAVAALVDRFGFDVVDVGPLRAGGRFEPGSAVYNVRQTAEELRASLGL